MSEHYIQINVIILFYEWFALLKEKVEILNPKNFEEAITEAIRLNNFDL